MTIKNYTFLSPSGTEFPVSATADRRLYLMLGEMNYSDIKMKHWVDPINTALNRIYNDTSFVLGGAYFEIQNHAVTLSANTTNFVHVNIDLSNVSAPVSISVETSDNSNTVDINANSGSLKRCFEIVTTSGSAVTSARSNLVMGEQKSRQFNLSYGITAYVTRIGNMVELMASSQAGTVIPTGIRDTGNSLPPGYRPHGMFRMPLVRRDTGASTMIVSQPSGEVQLVNNTGSSIPTTAYLEGTAFFFTDDPMPS